MIMDDDSPFLNSDVLIGAHADMSYEVRSSGVDYWLYTRRHKYTSTGIFQTLILAQVQHITDDLTPVVR